MENLVKPSRPIQADNTVEIEEELKVYSGCTRTIIGTKGATITKIKKSTDLKRIDIPARVDSVRARDLVNNTPWSELGWFSECSASIATSM